MCLKNKPATRTEKDTRYRFKTIAYISANITSKSYHRARAFLCHGRLLSRCGSRIASLKNREGKRETTREGWASTRDARGIAHAIVSNERRSRRLIETVHKYGNLGRRNFVQIVISCRPRVAAKSCYCYCCCASVTRVCVSTYHSHYAHPTTHSQIKPIIIYPLPVSDVEVNVVSVSKTGPLAKCNFTCKPVILRHKYLPSEW